MHPSLLVKVHYELLSLGGVQGKAVFLASVCMGSDFLAIPRLILDKAHRCFVARKLHNDVGAVGGHAVMGER